MTDNLPPIDSFKKRLSDLTEQMSKDDFYSDRRNSAEVSREHQHLTNLIGVYQSYIKVCQDIKESKELIEDVDADEELCVLAKEELPELEEKATFLHNECLKAMIPQDPTDSRNTIMEIRAGTGGDEAALFASNLYRMYCRFAERMGWKIETLGLNESELGGLKEVSFLISGQDVYKMLKYEGGGHRVQRVPETESAGRIHTSAATVAVLPEAEEVDVQLNPNDLEISVARASGPGGQGVNTTDSAVQILHKPTGMIVKCADERSQLKNKQKAMKVLLSRLLEKKIEEEQSKYAADRKNQIGSGDRSERIRTYNFPQSRLTDHRISLTMHSLPQIMDGELFDLIKSLQEADLKNKIENLINEKHS